MCSALQQAVIVLLQPEECPEIASGAGRIIADIIETSACCDCSKTENAHMRVPRRWLLSDQAAFASAT